MRLSGQVFSAIILHTWRHLKARATVDRRQFLVHIIELECSWLALLFLMLKEFIQQLKVVGRNKNKKKE